VKSATERIAGSPPSKNRVAGCTPGSGGLRSGSGSRGFKSSWIGRKNTWARRKSASGSPEVHRYRRKSHRTPPPKDWVAGFTPGSGGFEFLGSLDRRPNSGHRRIGFQTAGNSVAGSLSLRPSLSLWVSRSLCLSRHLSLSQSRLSDLSISLSRLCFSPLALPLCSRVEKEEEEGTKNREERKKKRKKRRKKNNLPCKFFFSFFFFFFLTKVKFYPS